MTTRVLILMTEAQVASTVYRAHLRGAFPDVEVNLVGHPAPVDPFLTDAAVLMTFSELVTDHMLDEGRNLRWVHALGTGVDGIVDSPALRGDVVVTNMRGIHGPPVSEAAVLAMLALSRHLPRVVRNQGAHRWDRAMPTLLHGKVVGILGVGVIAGELAARCRAFGMRVIGISSTEREVPDFDRIYARRDLEAVAPILDYLVVLAPRTADTLGLVGAAVLARMKPTAYLVNVARGGVVDESALLGALERGRLAGAALDVFDQEPLPPGHPFWDRDDVIITPRQGGYCDVYEKWTLPILDRNLRCFMAGDFSSMVNVIAGRR
jgi:D-2-hydroxyacid dehydrogenase (NADP+)